MDTLVKFNSQSTGRDRLFRLAQYSSKLIWAYLEKRNHDKDVINKLKNLEYSLSTGRKLFRFGKSMDVFYGALNSIHLHDPTLRYTITMSKINMAMYLLSDHILWLGRIGLADINNTKWSRISYKLWLYYLVMNLTRDLYEILKIIEKLQLSKLPYDLQHMRCRPTNSNSLLMKLHMLYDLLKMHKDVAVDTIKNSCDVCLPLAQLGYLNISPGTVGLLGMISSIAGMLPLLDPSYKLLPA